ncbi:putative leucine Rich Repeat family protein [Blattamonas nauphoetae]|uniref:Leucine Rich Repeat family protein n=1 Tax=Blattamonas nauphoetae TaxID=2049346 RepID=A0ABQ9YK61_9EUKA|nr:putative leucine Rich Repeat family protein [Blattamonas nauphoetae]
MEDTYFDHEEGQDIDFVCPLTEEEIEDIFLAKCDDLQKEPSNVQRDRFFQTVYSQCSGSVFNLSECGIGPNAMLVIEDVLAQKDCYSVLKLSSNNLRDKGASSLASLFSKGNNSICVLDLRSNDIGPTGATDLFNALMYNDTLAVMDLSSIAGANRNHIGSAAYTLAELLTRTQVLTSINLQSNSISLDGLTSIVHALAAYNNTLTHIELSSNSLGSEGAKLIGALLPNTAVKSLGFSENAIGDKGAIEIARGIFEAPEEIIESIEKKRAEAKEKRKKERERLGLPDSDDDGDLYDDDYDNERPKRRAKTTMNKTRTRKKTSTASSATRSPKSGTKKGMRTAEAEELLMDRSEQTDILGETATQPLDEIEEAEAPPLPSSPTPSELFHHLLPYAESEIERKKKPRLVRKIQGSGAFNPTGETVQSVVDAANEEIDENDDEDTADEDVEKPGVCHLEELTLSSNNITEKGAKVLAVALMKNRFLTKLDLSHNKVGVLGAQAVAEMVASNRTLLRLVLVDCKLSPSGSSQIGRALGHNGNMEYIDLSGNGMGDEGARGFADGITSNPQLRVHTLILAGNGITDVGGVALGKALEGNKSVQRLGLSSNELENETVNTLIATLRTNTTLLTVELKYNNAAHILILGMVDLLSENKKRRKETFSQRLSETLSQLRADVALLNDTRYKLADRQDELMAQCQELIQKRALLEETKLKCQEKENAMLAEIDANSKLMYALTDETTKLAADTSKAKTEGDYKYRTMQTRINRTQQSKVEGERKRKKQVREFEQDGVETEAEKKDREKHEEEDRLNATLTSSHNTLPPLTARSEEGGKTDRSRGSLSNADSQPELAPVEQKMTMTIARELRPKLEEQVAEAERLFGVIKKWTQDTLTALRLSKATKKWQDGPPLPFDFLPEEEKAVIRMKQEDEEKRRKAQELKALLGGGDATQAKPKKPRPKSKK